MTCQFMEKFKKRTRSETTRGTIRTLEQSGMTLNKEKCTFSSTNVKFFCPTKESALIQARSMQFRKCQSQKVSGSGKEEQCNQFGGQIYPLNWSRLLETVPNVLIKYQNRSSQPIQTTEKSPPIYIPLNRGLTSESVIQHTCNVHIIICTTWNQMSDNGPQYVSYQVCEKLWICTQDHHPQGNGEAERAVKTIKSLF